jgi:hypothetical protein
MNFYAASAAEMGGKSSAAMTFPFGIPGHESPDKVNLCLNRRVHSRGRSLETVDDRCLSSGMCKKCGIPATRCGDLSAGRSFRLAWARRFRYGFSGLVFGVNAGNGDNE